MKVALSLVFVSFPLLFFFQNCGPQTLEVRESESEGLIAKQGPHVEDEEFDVVKIGLHQGEQAKGDSVRPEYICVLEGSGDSVRLGYVAEGLSVVSTVCMTKRACEELVDAKFAVKQAVQKDFCPRENTFLATFSDEEIQELISTL